MLEQHYNMKMASKKLGISVKTLRRLIAANGIPLFKVGHTYVVHESDLIELPTRVYSVDEIANEMLGGEN
jgi:excisionase family DNA binding protein